MKYFKLLLIAAAILVLPMSCSKESSMIQVPEDYLIIDKTPKFIGQKKVGYELKIWVNMPEPFTNNLQWYFDYGHSDNWNLGGDTVYHTYRSSGVYNVKVVGWSGEIKKSSAGFSDVLKLQIQD